MNLNERLTALKELKEQYLKEVRHLEERRQEVINNLLKIEGQLELLTDLQKEESKHD